MYIRIGPNGISLATGQLIRILNISLVIKEPSNYIFQQLNTN